MAGILEQLPDLSEIARVKGDAEVGLNGVIGGLGKLDASADGSPLQAILSGVASLNVAADIDLSGVTERLPNVLQTVTNALPPSSLEFVESLEGAYKDAAAFVTDNPIAQQVTEGRTLQQVALAVIEDTLKRFDDE